MDVSRRVMDVAIGADEPITRLGVRSLLAGADGVRIVAEMDVLRVCVYPRVHPVNAIVIEANFSPDTAQSVARILATVRETAVVCLGHGPASVWLSGRLNSCRSLVLNDLAVSAESLVGAIYSLVEQMAISSSREGNGKANQPTHYGQPQGDGNGEAGWPSGYGQPQGNQLETALSALSGREWEVLSLISRGFTDDQIARELVLSVHTVKSHVRSLLRKLRTCNRTAATAFYISLGSSTVAAELVVGR